MDEEQRYFEDVQVGDELPTREFGPLSIVDTVRWCGFQENWTARLHYDREYVREHSGLRTFIASGAYREALLARTLTDWIGPQGLLRKLSIRQTAPTFEGDLMIYGARVVEKSASAAEPWVACEVDGKNQDGQQIITGQCTLTIPARSQVASEGRGGAGA